MKCCDVILGGFVDPPKERCRCKFCNRRRQEIRLARRLMVEMPREVRIAIRKLPLRADRANP
jgi:hypothetical protein